MFPLQRVKNPNGNRGGGDAVGHRRRFKKNSKLLTISKPRLTRSIVWHEVNGQTLWINHHHRPSCWNGSCLAWSSPISLGSLGRMRELADVIEQAQAALVKNDLRGIERHTATQRELCNLLCAVGTQTKPRCHSKRWSELSDEFIDTGNRVRNLNRVHAALLRRARRTVDIFCRVLASSDVTYAPPRREVMAALRDK